MIAIHQTAERMAQMDEWNQKQHGGSGLIQRVIASTWTAEQAEQATLNFLQEHVPAGASPMCGNSICQDRRFLARLMPELEKFFHYRNLDVSTVKELAKRWKPSILELYTKESRHLALDDIYDSINELKFYRQHFISL